MVLVLCKNKPLADHVKCKDRLEREMLKEKGSRRAQIPADDKQWISVCLSRGPSEILHSTFTDFCLGLILNLKRRLFFPLSNLFFLLSLLLLHFVFFFLVHKRKVDLFQILHSPGIFAFHSMAQNTENLFLQMVWSSSPSTKYWIKFWRFVWLKCTCCPCWGKWGGRWPAYWRSCLSVLSSLALLSWWSWALLQGPFLTLSDVRRRCILVSFSKYAGCF